MQTEFLIDGEYPKFEKIIIKSSLIPRGLFKFSFEWLYF